MPAPTPFTIAVPDADLADLRVRLSAARWPDEVPGLHWEAGIPLGVMKQLASHWAGAFDWRSLEARLNARPQFKWGYADPDAPAGTPPLRIHFFHLKGRRGPAGSTAPRPAPVLMLHGWPGSFLEFEGVIEELTHPGEESGTAPGLDLIIPSLPGYGFSDPPTVPGWGVRKVARALDALMREGLGIPAYNVQGGDWGSLVARALGTEHALAATVGARPGVGNGGCGAIHVNMPVARPRLSAPWTLLQAANAATAKFLPLYPFVTKEECAGIAAGLNYATRESGYFRLQATRPQSLAYSLTDSPVGLLAWIGEKFGVWTDTSGPVDPTAPDKAAARAAARAARLLEVFSLDALVGNVAVYWHGHTAASSVRLYRETEIAGDVGWLLDRSVRVPTGVLSMPKELFRPPRAWVAAHYDLKRWTQATRGGHFAAMENPQEFSADVLAFFEEHGVREA